MKLVVKTAATAAALACAAFAQDRDADQVKKMMVELQQMAAAKLDANAAAATRAALMTVVKNAPYSADQITESTLTLGDGTRIHNESKVTITRDSQGRVRRETPESITIWDPVENITYYLNPKTMTVAKTRVFTNVTGSRVDANKAFAFHITTDGPNPPDPAAHELTADGVKMIVVQTEGNGTAGIAEKKMRAAEEASAVDATAGLARIRPDQAKRESLGVQRMEGISAEGTRETNMIDAGVIGNDRPLTIVSERWYSQELQTEMMTRHNDPRTGEQMTHLTNVRLGEPDPSLFQVPAGYQKSGDLPMMFNRKE